MSFLEQITNEQKEILVSLPYRVGYFVSQSDTKGGAEADARELQALSNIVQGFAGEVFGSETVQHIIAETVANQNQWPEWAGKMDTVIHDCRVSVDILSEVVDEKEVSAFKQRLIEVGEAVALAFREFDGYPSVAQALRIHFVYWSSRLDAAVNKKPYRSLEEFMNISFEERAALSAVAEALGASYT